MEIIEDLKSQQKCEAPWKVWLAEENKGKLPRERLYGDGVYNVFHICPLGWAWCFMADKAMGNTWGEDGINWLLMTKQQPLKGLSLSWR